MKNSIICWEGLFASSRILLALLILVLFLPKCISAQPHSAKPGDDVAFNKLLVSPGSFTPTQRVEIYNQHIGPYYSTDIDTVKILFREMYDFGIEIKDEYVMGSALCALGELNRMEGRYQQAIPLFLESLQYMDDYPNNKCSLQGSLSNVYMLVDHLDSSAIYADLSLQLALEIKDTSMYTSAYLQKGVLLMRQEKYYSALEQFFLALDFADVASIPLRKANTYGLIAGCYQAAKDYDHAITYGQLALDLAKEHKYTRMAGEMNERLGVYYLQQKDFDLAESHFLASLADQGITDNPKSRIIIYSNLATLASQRNEISLGEYYLQEASPYLLSDISDLHKAAYYQANARVAMRKSQWKESIRSFGQVLRISKEIGNEQLRLDGYEGLAAAYRKSGAYQTALIYGDSISQLHHELDLAFQNKTMLDLNHKYEANIKNEEIATLSAMQNVQALELNQRHKQLMFSLLGLFLAIAALGAFGYALNMKSRIHKTLSEKNIQLSEALDNNKMLIKEIHHRVKNNLQVVSSLLNLQSRFETDNTVLRAINTGKYRVQSMSLLHQNLYLNEDLHSIKVKKYFEDLSRYLVKGYPLNGKEVQLELDVEDITLDIEAVVPMGLICNELITNALKYAYVNTPECQLSVSIKEANGKIRLMVKDNGVGTSFTQLPEKSTSMGTQLIKSFANKLKASIEIDNFEGTEFKLTFERKEQTHSLNVLKNVAG